MSAPANVAPEETLDEFCVKVKTLLLAIQNYFPECEKTTEALQYIEMIVPSAIEVEEDGSPNAPKGGQQPVFRGNDMLKKYLINEWYTSMLPYLDACNQRDSRALLGADIEALEKFGFREKWSEFDEESKEVMWEYLIEINTLAVWYCEGEKNIKEKDVMDRVTKAADGLVEQHADGRITIDPKKLQDPNAMANIASVLGDVQNIMGNGEDLSGIAQMASSMLGGFGGPPGQADLSQLFGGGGSFEKPSKKNNMKNY